MYKFYGGIEYFYDKDYELFIDCLNYAVTKENEIPRLIEIIFNKITGNNFNAINKNMRSAEDILKDYGLGGI